MSRLPTVGQDNNEWGTILNDYLSVEHNEDGTQKLLTESVSRTIYVSATGDDDTGDGSEALPYLTIGKALGTIKNIINFNVTITISVGAGVFLLTESDHRIIQTLRGAGEVIFQGSMTLADSGFTVGSFSDPTDQLALSVSGGNTSSWTANQWQFYFIKRSSSVFYHPITHNTSTTIGLASQPTGLLSEIYQTSTQLTISSNYLIAEVSVTFKELKLQFSTGYIIGQSVLDGSASIAVTYVSCFLNSATSNTISLSSKVAMNACAVNNLALALYNNINQLNIIYIKRTNAFCVAFYNKGGEKNYNLHNAVIENSGTGTSDCGIYSIGEFIYQSSSINYYIKFINCNVAILYGDNSVFTRTPSTLKLILKNVNYFIRKHSTVLTDYVPVMSRFNYAYITGAPNTRWFYDQMYEFVNPTSGRNIQITGLIYPEYESNLSATLSDNATTNVIIGNKLQNRSIIIDYTITRGTTYEMGRLQIVHNGTTLSIAESTPVGDDVGVTFAVNFNTNEIRLACTLTSTGTAATLKYNATRVMITPLTI
ncbi:MAG TPA: hypothetical protein VK153_03385 [Candidatus Paceibacterota bacterium]|nr:hypothetical protein [Candidatus Paceibacterota bacterium]